MLARRARPGTASCVTGGLARGRRQQTVQPTNWEEPEALARRARLGIVSCATGRSAHRPWQTVQPTNWEEPEALARRARPRTADY